ncbi:MAG: YncE family protein [Deltaproteobacteria bacterium]|nr:YncE family protein [Deltaproteobacteria bacterium]MBI3391355.1 YncE family protein [Deltaproteobacteria bacterium]
MKFADSLMSATPLVGAAMLLLTGCSAMSQLSGGGGVVSSAVIASIPVGEGPTLLALSADGSRLYAASNSQFSVINTAGNAVIATISIDPYPAGLALTPDSARAFVTNLFAVKLTTVDLAINAVDSPIQLFASLTRGGFGRVSVSPDGTAAYVVNGANQAMAVVDTVTPDTASLMMDMQPVDVAVAPDGRTAYVAGCKNFCATGTVEVLDTTSRLVTTSFAVGPKPYRIVLSPDGKRAYTTNLGGPSVSVIDLATNQVTATVPVPIEPTGLALSRDGARIYVASQMAGTITVIDASTNSVQATAKVADNAREVVVAADGRRVYVSTLHSVIVVDAQSLGAASTN